MTSALRAGVTAGIALVSSGVLVATPAVAPPPDIEARAVELTAGLFDPYIDLVTNTFNNLVTIGAHWLADPLPVLTQVIVNWYDYVQTTISSLFDAGKSFINGLINLPDQFHTLLDALSIPDWEEVAAELVLIGISINPLQGLAHALLAIPYDILGNYVSAGFADLHALQVPVGLAAFTAAHATIAEVGVVVHDFFSDLQNGNLWAAFVQLVDAPAQILNAALNSDTPGQAGL
ncbi:MAG TPA: hypothetical protein VFQ37_17785, partial [Mycobacterium sp.]|nr:hypothetical protein [Mycobacterium sp.]